MSFVEPGNVITRARATLRVWGGLGAVPHVAAEPAYHLVRNDRTGVTMVNIGVGPGNA